MNTTTDMPSPTFTRRRISTTYRRIAAAQRIDAAVNGFLTRCQVSLTESTAEPRVRVVDRGLWPTKERQGLLWCRQEIARIVAGRTASGDRRIGAFGKRPGLDEKRYR